MASSASSLLLAGQAAAASEVAQLAGDNRLSTIALLLVPVLGWVGFQIGGPALRQLDNMNDKASKAIVGGALGLAALSLSGSADAASEVAQLAGDNRLSTIALLLVPVLGWVGFQIGGPALRQLDNMNDKAGK